MDKITNISVYKKVSSVVIDILKKHRDSGFRDSWLSLLNGDMLAYNAFTGKTYDWLNQVLLSYYCQQSGYGVNRWLTRYQARQLGASLCSEGEKPSNITFFCYRHYDRRSEKDITAVVKASIRYGLDRQSLDYFTVPSFLFHEVYNISQFEGLPEEYYGPGEVEEQGIEGMDIVADGFLKECGAIVGYRDIGSFQVLKGFINVPFKRNGLGRDPFCKLAYNSVCQWATEDRLSSPGVVNSLVCELFGAYLAAKQGLCMPISADPVLLGSWIRALRGDCTLFTKCSAYARKCLGFVSKSSFYFAKSRQPANHLN